MTPGSFDVEGRALYPGPRVWLLDSLAARGFRPAEGRRDDTKRMAEAIIEFSKSSLLDRISYSWTSLRRLPMSRHMAGEAASLDPRLVCSPA